MNNEIEPRANGDFNTKTDFKTWERETLERFAREAADEVAELRCELRVALAAWREVVAQTQQPIA